MDMTLTLPDRLRTSAQLWAEATGGTFARLGREAINDGGFFTRLDSPNPSCTTATLEKFARFLGDAANWPDGMVPGDVAAFVHVVGVSPAALAPATGQIGDLSGPLGEAAPSILRQAQHSGRTEVVV